MKFKDSDFDRLMFNVYTLPKTKSVLKEFPDISRHKEFELDIYWEENQGDPKTYKKTSVDKDKALRYFIFLYDKNTPLLKEADLNKRKHLALSLAGFKPAKEGYDIGVMKMIQCEIYNANKMVIRFIRMQNDLDFALLTSLTENYFNTLRQLNSNEIFNKDGDLLKDTESKGKLSKMLPEMLDQIKAISKTLFHGDSSLVYTADSIAEEEAASDINVPYAEMFAKDN